MAHSCIFTWHIRLFLNGTFLYFYITHFFIFIWEMPLFLYDISLDFYVSWTLKQLWHNNSCNSFPAIVKPKLYSPSCFWTPCNIFSPPCPPSWFLVSRFTCSVQNYRPPLSSLTCHNCFKVRPCHFLHLINFVKHTQHLRQTYSTSVLIIRHIWICTICVLVRQSIWVLYFTMTNNH